MEYARIVDIHEWYRTWGIDWARLDDNFDLVGIRAGVGTYQDALLSYFVDRCNKIGKPYFTYHIPTPAIFGVSVETQAALYLSWPGVRDAVQCMDIEPPYQKYPDIMISANEALRFIRLLERPIWYSNKLYLDKISWPAELAQHLNWVAGYPDVYKIFESFLVFHTPELLPSWYRNTIYAKRCAMWQFSKKGDAFYYLSIPPNGIKEADLSVSTIERDALMAIMAGGNPIPPEPEPEPEPGVWQVAKMTCLVNLQNVRSDHVVNSSNVVGAISKGQQVNVIGVWSDPVTLGNVWAKLERPSGWAAIRHGGTTYLVG
jgi:GH25 family lysozyme M1 (1,4-beta-N-acetylmuramidase)